MGSRKSGGQIRIMRRRRRVISAKKVLTNGMGGSKSGGQIRSTRRRVFSGKKGFTNGTGGRKSGGKIRITRRRVVVFSAKNVFTSGIGGRRKSEGQLDAWHVDQGKRALLGSRHKQLRRVGLSFKYGTKFTEPPASVVRCISKRSRKHYHQGTCPGSASNTQKVLVGKRRTRPAIIRRLSWELLPL